MKTNLQELRRQAGFKSAEAFATHVGMSKRTYTNYEQGTTNLSLEKAWFFADALGEVLGRHVSLDEIAGRRPPGGGELSTDEITILDGYRAAEDTHKAAMLMNARFQLTLAEQAATKKEGVAEAG